GSSVDNDQAGEVIAVDQDLFFILRGVNLGKGSHDKAPHAPPTAERSSLGLDRASNQPAPARAASADPASPAPAACPERAADHEAVVITELPARVGDAELTGRERDTLELTAEERRWARRRVTTTAGRTLALALPTGSGLTPGAVVYVGSEWFVVVECAQEPCFAV